MFTFDLQPGEQKLLQITGSSDFFSNGVFTKIVYHFSNHRLDLYNLLPLNCSHLEGYHHPIACESLVVCFLACECALSGKLSVLHKHTTLTHTLASAVPFLHLSICANVRDAIKLNLVINQPQLAGFLLLLPPLNLFP